MAGSKRNKLKKMLSPQPTSDTMADTMGGQDDQLMDDLLAQLDSRDKTVQVESATIIQEMNIKQQSDSIESGQKQTAKSRYEARQARKAAAITESYAPDDPAVQARLVKEAKDEEDCIRKVCKEHNLELVEINPDGHCLFSAVADQLALLGLIPPGGANYATTRTVAANYIHANPDDFLPFLPSTGGEDGAGSLDAGFMNPAQFDTYCKTMRDTSHWGGEPEIVALSRAYNVPILVVQGGTPPIVTHHPTGGKPGPNDPVVWISYHRRLYGLGEHYNSLRPARGLIQKTLGM